MSSDTGTKKKAYVQPVLQGDGGEGGRAGADRVHSPKLGKEEEGGPGTPHWKQMQGGCQSWGALHGPEDCVCSRAGGAD